MPSFATGNSATSRKTSGQSSEREFETTTRRHVNSNTALANFRGSRRLVEQDHLFEECVNEGWVAGVGGWGCSLSKLVLCKEQACKGCFIGSLLCAVRVLFPTIPSLYLASSAKYMIPRCALTDTVKQSLTKHYTPSPLITLQPSRLRGRQ